MGTVVNLNRYRKQKARKDAEALAAANRAKFGRSKDEKARDAALSEDAQRKLDALRREPPAED